MLNQETEFKTENRSEAIVVTDKRYECDQFLLPKYYNDYLDKILIPYGLILDRIEKLAYEIYQRFLGEEVHLICILKSSRAFYAQLLKFLERFSISSQNRKSPAYFEHFVCIKSYDDMQPHDEVKFLFNDLSELKDKNVLIVEDIIDTGATLTKFSAYLQKVVKPRAITVTVLLKKRHLRSCAFSADFTGFYIPDVFVVGFGMDFYEWFRDLRHLAVLNPTGIAKIRSLNTHETSESH